MSSHTPPSLALVAAAGLTLGAGLALPAGAQVFSPLPIPWDIPVVDEGSPSFGAPFARTAQGLFNDDCLLDALVLVGSDAYVVLNPADWTLALQLPGSFDDLCLMDGGEGALDAILTAGESGLVLWRWTEAPTAGFEAVTLEGSWDHPTLVDFEMIEQEDLTFGIIGVYDASQGALYALVIDAGVPAGTLPLHAMVGTWELAPPVRELALVDLDGSTVPDLATLSASQVRVLTTYGATLLSESVSADRGWLWGFDPDSAGKKRLACLSVSGGSNRLLVLDDTGVEDCRTLPYAIGGAAFGYLDPDDPNEDLLIQTGTLGELAVIEAGCDETGTGLSFSVMPTCHVPVSGGWTGSGWGAALSAPCFGDFDMDGEDEILAPDDQQGTLRWIERQSGAGSAIVPLDLRRASTFGDAYSFSFERSVLATRGATHVECIVWAWDWDLALGVNSLRNTAVGYACVALPEPCVEPPCPVELGFTLDFGDLAHSEILGLEVRALNINEAGSVRAIDTACYAYTENCTVFEQLEQATGISGWCGSSGSLGDIIAGFLPIPRMPTFAEGTPPVIPWQVH